MVWLADELIPDDYDSGSCHYCGGSTICAGVIISTHEGHYEQLVVCESCGAEWYEEWVLIGIKEQTPPVRGEVLP